LTCHHCKKAISRIFAALAVPAVIWSRPFFLDIDKPVMRHTPDGRAN
jgi:hypothetical protein